MKRKFYYELSYRRDFLTKTSGDGDRIMPINLRAGVEAKRRRRMVAKRGGNHEQSSALDVGPEMATTEKMAAAQKAPKRSEQAAKVAKRKAENINSSKLVK